MEVEAGQRAGTGNGARPTGSRIAGKEFNVGTEFRHDQGGCWKIIGVTADTRTLNPMPGTAVKPRDRLLGRKFRIYGVWFKVAAADARTVVLKHG